MRYRCLSLAIAILTVPLAAEAQPFQGLYVGAGVGYNLPENVPLAGNGAFPLQTGVTPAGIGALPLLGISGGTLQPHGGIVGLGSVGYALGNGMRFELEGNYRHAGLDRTTTAFSNSGSMNTYAAMVNGLFDFDVGAPWIFPYIGGGVGYAWTNLSSQLAFTPTSFPLLSSHVDQTQGGFAFQAIGGLSFPIPNVPGLSLTAEYRFFGIPGRETFSGVQFATVTPTATPVSLRAEHQYNHSFLFGVRYAFNVAAPVPVPPPQPPPAPQAARSYLVFFDWDKATLGDRARQIVKDAADNSTHVQYTRIEVNGYTDTSGTPRYNMGLSLRRARAVQAELIKDGVPASVISIQGFGDTNLLVPTGPGVREPQNRRVEIVIR
jgi:outer membrane protein OmpA-like peptidoglycan-associated protein